MEENVEIEKILDETVVRPNSGNLAKNNSNSNEAENTEKASNPEPTDEEGKLDEASSFA